MNLKRTLAMAFGCAAFAAWLSAAIAPTGLPLAPVEHRAPAAELSGAALAQEIARLHERLRPDSSPRAQPRNLFAFRVGRVVAPPAPQASPAAVEERVPSQVVGVRFGLTLSGLAEDVAPDTADTRGGVVRTAILSGHGQVFLVKEGDTLVDGEATYTVAQVSAESVELADRRDGTVHRLSLR